MNSRCVAGAVLLLACLCGFGSPAEGQLVQIDWVTVGAPENPPDTTGFGAVAKPYQIGKLEVTNAQYVAFLNAVASTDTYSLYSVNMSSGLFGGIDRSGASGSYVYIAKPGRADMPVNEVSWYDCLRFVNWLHNGQPTGAQDQTTTESGVYSFSGETSVGARDQGASVFLPTENEWYKAAYYHAESESYFDYPAGSDVPTVCALPGAVANTANCLSVAGDLTLVASYTGAASPSGTFDQGGNLFEWSETINGATRVVRGGSFGGAQTSLAASYRGGFEPTGESLGVGFRVARPAPAFWQGVPTTGPFGLSLLSGLLAFAGRWGLRRRQNSAR